MSDISKLTAELSVEEKNALLAQLLHKQASQSKYELPLSSNQQALWFLYKLAPKSWANNVLFAGRIHSHVDIPALQGAFQALIDRHPSLRTTYTENDSRPVQHVHNHLKVHFEETDASAWSQDELNNRLLEEAHRPFDLERGPMLRVNLFTQSATEHILLLIGHHIAIDFWSLTILLDEIRVLYPAQKASTQAPLPPLELQYTDYIRWQTGMLAGAEGERLWVYWQRQLAGSLPVLNLPTDRPRPPVVTYRGASHVFKLSEELTRQLKALAKTESATLYMTLLAVFQLLLYRYTEQEDILVGSPTNGRSQREFERIVGNFINPVVLRADLSGNPTFKAFLAAVRHTVQDAFKHQDYPFGLLVERLAPTHDPSRSPLFQVLFTLHKLHRFEELSEFIVPSHTEARIDFGGLSAEPFALPQQEGQVDLILEMIETGGELSGVWKYNTDLFETATIARMAGHFQTLLEGVVADSDQNVSTLPLLTEAERLTLLVELNDTQVDYLKDVCIHKVFEAQVRQQPDAIAAGFADKHLTYQELNVRANKIAHHLQTLGVGPEVVVGICMERSLEIVVGLLGILKAGGAYLFLDPTYPKERLTFMLEETQVPVLLTQQRLVERLPEHRAREIYLDTGSEVIATESEENPASKVTVHNLAYVMYTSGSTGRPKGVTITHANVLHYFQGINTRLQINSSDVYLHTASFSFSSSVRQLMVPLSVGAKVLIASYEQTREPLKIFNVIQKHGVTVSDTVPSFWQYALEALEGLDQASRNAVLKSSLRLIVLSGDILTWEIPKAILSLDFDHRPRIINVYGQTETIGNTSYPLPTEFDNRVGPVPTGKANPNNQIYILNSQLQPVPIGVTGELHLGGPGLARGYLNRPELTAEKFIPNPFSDESTPRIYKTGDLARYLPDGNIEILARVDEQVKLRGMRIELGEIEAVLRQHPAVQMTVVIAREDGQSDKYLVAYVVTKEQAPTLGELHSFLKQRLPEHMVPSAFVLLDALPLTPNGKIARRALPAPDQQARLESEEPFVAPRDTVELQLTKIWEEVLGIQPIGVKNNFFDLGGHSLLAVRLFTQIEKKFGKSLPLATLFQAATVEQLASLISQEEGLAPWSLLVPIQTAGDKPPLFCPQGAGGNVLCYYDLARYLGPEQPVYGLQAQGLDGKQAPYTRVEDMAADYIKQIRTVQPEGPYFLAGLSSGGRVAFEMAQQLHAQGQKVALVAMFDSYAPGYPKLLPIIPRLLTLFRYQQYQRLRRAYYSVGKLVRLEPKQRLTLVLEKAKTVKAKIFKRRSDKQSSEVTTGQLAVGRITDDTKRNSGNINSLENWMHDLSISLLKRTPWGWLASRYELPGIKNTSLPQALKAVQEANIKASKRYVAKVYPARVTLIRASKQPVGYYFEPELGWRGLAAGGFELHEVPGLHWTIVKEPNVRILAEKLRTCLDKAQVHDSGVNHL